jgi:hypothetical protein
MLNRNRRSPLAVAVTSALLAATPGVHAQSVPAEEGLQLRMDRRSQTLDSMMRADLVDPEARQREIRRSLDQHRGRGTDPAGPPVRVAQGGEEQRQIQGVEEQQRQVQVGTAPGPDASPSVPQIFEQPSVLTPRGRTVLEPSLQYSYSSSNRVAIVGFTVIPAVLVGLIDVREVRRNTFSAALTVRHGLTDRFEIEGRIPYVYRSDSTVSREANASGQATTTEQAFDADGNGIGDVEVTARYQFQQASRRSPYLIGSLRFKSRTGRDPFEVTTNCVQRCVAGSGTGEPLDLPTGSGFYTLQPGITWLYPSDPAVFFGSFSYAFNFKRSDVSRRLIDGSTEFLGDVEPGNVFGFNFGMGLSLNERASFSVGVDVSSIGRTKVNGVNAPASVRTQLATLLLGYSHRLREQRTLNLAFGAGLTRDTPDFSLTVRMPFAL